MARSIGSSTISFGLVSVPCKLYTSCSAEKVAFHLINAPTGNRLKQQYVDAVDGKIVPKEDMIKGFEYAKDKCVTFSVEEIKGLEADRTNIIDIVEFIPANSVDLVAVEKSYYLGPDKGADKGYLLLSQIMDSEKVIAVGRWSTRGKDELVLVRSYRGGLILHQMYYANEVRSFDEVFAGVAKIALSEKETNLGVKLIEQLSVDAFDPSKYADEYAQRVIEAAQAKVAGGEIKMLPASTTVPMSDLFAALQASIDSAAKGKRKAG
jgi:DNA end-binding protein Ku